MRDMKWLESVMDKHNLSVYDVTGCLYEVLVVELQDMYESGQIDTELEQRNHAIICDIEGFVIGREEAE